jgi:hypothetical protein
MTFNEWFYSKSYRNKYTPVDPAYLVAQEAWEAAHEACAKVCEEIDPPLDSSATAMACAVAIRSRT